MQSTAFTNYKVPAYIHTWLNSKENVNKIFIDCDSPELTSRTVTWVIRGFPQFDNKFEKNDNKLIAVVHGFEQVFSKNSRFHNSTMNRRDKEILMDAVIGGTFKDVENAFKEHILVFDESYFDYKLLQAGLKRRHQSILNFLINKVGCRAGTPNEVKLEETPLHLAMKLNNENIIKKLLSKGAHIFYKDDKGKTPLLAGFKNENYDAVRALLTHCKPICQPEDKDAILHFHIACVTNHIPAAKHYLNCGVNPNSPLSLDSEEYSGLNPVQFAAEKNYYKLFQELVCYEADLSIKNAKGLTPLHIIYYISPIEDRVSRIKQTFENGNDSKFINAVDSNRVSHFHLCCMLSAPDFVQIFIDNGANVNSSISSNCTIDPGFTPLHFAVIKAGSEKVVELLLKSGADSNKKDKKRKTPLHLACQLSGYHKAPIVRMLLDSKANPATTDKHGYTALHMEFYNMNSDSKNIFDMLLPKISGKVNYTNDEGVSHFHIACTTSNISQVKGFLDSGVEVNSCVSSGMYSGYTALHFAVLHNQKDIVKLLLKKNAQVNIKTKEFQATPLHLACEFNYTKFRGENPNNNLVDFKSFSVDLDSTFHRENQIDIINLLLLHGAHVDAKDYQGLTPLLHACMIEENYCKLRWSYKSHVYLSRLEREGLIKEINTRLKEIIEIFLCNKASVVACSNKQESILHIICKYSSVKIPEKLIKLILTKGTDIDAVDNAGLTPLHVAVKVDNKRMARMLLRHKANVNIKCQDSKIPLHTVFKKVLNNWTERDMFCSLLENGSDVNILVDEENKVLLHDAIERGDDFVIKKLLHYGADINLEDSLGNSCVSPLFQWENEDLGRWDEWELAEIFQIIYIHVQKLLALGLYVSKKIQKYCKQFYPRHKALSLEDNDYINLDNILHDCTKELEGMKLIKLDNYTSLYSILLKDPHEISKFVRNKNLIKIIKAKNLHEEFPLYSYLLTLQFRRGLIRSDLLQFAKTSLANLINIDLPDLCSDLIIKYLKNEDIANLKAAAPLRRTLKRKLKDTDSNRVESLPKIQKEDENRREEGPHLRSRVSKISKKR